MATTQFQSVTLQSFQGPDSSGTMTANGSATFPTNVTAAGVTLQEFGASFGKTDHHVKSLSASITNVQFIGTKVSFDAAVQLIDIISIRNQQKDGVGWVCKSKAENLT